ncbi:VENN motif pre-toxin domain-containing protein, partial [Buttiauxella sp. S19-1]|uniref:VENN motif pre-toxin domain-containing protein n=1 Tax=Buttiauxella sp. S19-1 TaxID=941430 RepID=UPI00235A0794
AADIARTQGELSAIKDAQEKMKSVSPEDRAKAKVQWEKENPGKTATPDNINSQVYKNYYDDAFAASGMGTGGAVQRGIQAATAALQGLAGGNIAGALAGASAPELAHLLKSTEGDPAVNAIAHAILGGAVAALQGNSAAAGAVGAASGELAARAIAAALYPDTDISKLTEEQRQTVSALASISAGMAGGIAGGDVAGAATGANAGKNAVENNLLSGTEDGQTAFVQEHAKNVMSCTTDPGSDSCKKGLAMQNALMVALPAGLGGGVLAAATPEIAAAAQAAIQACVGSVVLCLNNVGIQLSEAVVPGGVGAGGAIGIGKTAAEASAAKAEAVAANAAKNAGNGSSINSIKNAAETQVSVDQKLANYLLDKQHPAGGSKAEWFDSALGFNKTNSDELAKQIVFDSGKAVKTAETQFGTKYDQVIPITGTNGRTINVKFGWIENNDGVVRLVTAIPAKK